MNKIDRERLGKLLDKLRPIFWIWFISALTLVFVYPPIGINLLLAYFTTYAVLVFLGRPKECSRGHTDIGYYYGHWSCRTCYKLKKEEENRSSRKWISRFDKSTKR